MKKTLRNFVGFFSIVMMLVGLIAGTAAVSADTTPQTETFKVTGYETATQQELTGMTASMPITTGVTGEGLVAEGYNAALKISSLGNQGNGLNYAYLVSYPSNSLPFATVPEKLSEWETMKFYLSHEVKTAGAEPRGLQVLLLDKNGGAIAGAYVLLDHCRRDNPTGKFWVELEPSDFYSFPNYSITKTKLTAFPDAYSIGFRIDNYMSPAGEADVKDADGLLTPHYLYYSGGDCWTAIDVYISGLQYARKAAPTTTTTTTNTTTTTTVAGGATTTTTTVPEVDKNAPFAPTDNHKHTYFPALENCSQEDADKFQTSEKIYAGITDKDLIAPGATAGLHIDYQGKIGWGMMAFMHKDASGNNVVPFDVVPADLPEYDGMRFYLKAVKGTTELPKTITLRLMNGWMQEIAVAKIDIYDADGVFSDWIYLTPADFGYPLGFPACETLEFKMDDTYQAGDGACDYDLYFSGLSYYKEVAGGADDDNDDDEDASDVGNADTGAVANTMGAVVAMVVSMSVVCVVVSRRKSNRA